MMKIANDYAYKITNDLDFAGYSWISRDFRGVINGQNHILKNLAIVVENQSESKQTYGLFNYFRGTIHDLNIKDVYISVKTKGESTVGSIAGYMESGSIFNSSVSGIISNEKGEVGGFVGYSCPTITISNSYNSGSVSGQSNVGGFVGFSSSTITISNSYNSGSVSGQSKHTSDFIVNAII